MNVQTKNTREGFTIIEVVLVLAIAGLIFLMVFIALPALQRNQRDQARKNDVSTVAGAVTSFSSSNRGNFPTTNQLRDYLDDLSGNTPRDGVTVNSDRPETINSTALVDGQVVVYPGMKCEDGGSSNTAQELERGTARQFSVVTRLETGTTSESGGGQFYCQTS